MSENPTAVPPDTTAGPRGRFARLYGAEPWHLLSLLACFAVTGYATSRLLDQLPALVRITLWFVGAAVVWDLLLGPGFALADKALLPLWRVRPRSVPVLNYVRVPAVLSALLLLVWAPLIFQRSQVVFRLKSGLPQDPYLGRWLAVTAGLFLLSAVAYGVALLRARDTA